MSGVTIYPSVSDGAGVTLGHSVSPYPSVTAASPSTSTDQLNLMTGSQVLLMSGSNLLLLV